MDILKIPKNYLMLIAGCVWMFAGIMVSTIGLPPLVKHFSGVSVVSAFCVFLLFYLLIFRKIVGKHVYRVKTKISERGYIWQFFDIPSYIIMIFMIVGGIMLRKSNLLPENIIAPIYSGIGLALFSCGTRFIAAFLKKYVLR